MGIQGREGTVMKNPRFSAIFGWCSVLFAWTCWALAYMLASWWWAIVSLIPYLIYQAFLNKDGHDGGP